MFRQKKLNRFLYRNVRAMSLYNTVPTHRGIIFPIQYTLPKAVRFGTQNLKVAKGRIFPVLGTLYFSVLYRDIARTFLYRNLFSFF